MTTRTRWLWCATALLTTGVSAQQGPIRDRAAIASTIGRATLAGVVLHDGTGRPVRRAVVTVISADSGYRATAITNDAGAFAFRQLAASRYSIGVTKPSFVSTAYGATRPNRPGTTVALADGQARTDLVV